MSNRLTLYSILSLALLILATPFATRLKIVTDMTSLLPEGESFQSMRTINQFPVMGRIVAMIEFAKPLESGLKDIKIIDRFAKELGTIEGVKSARSGITLGEQENLARFFFKRRFHMAPYSPETVDRHLAITRARMTLPGSEEIRKVLTSDPIGLTGSLINQMQYSSDGSIDLFEDHFFSKERKNAFIFIRPGYSQLDVDGGDRMADSIRQKFQNVKKSFSVEARLYLTGGLVIASDSARIMKRDVRLALIFTLIGLVALFFVTLRSFGLLLLFIPPIVVGGIAGMAFVWLTLGKIHALTLGFGIALVGISVDYLLHIIVAASFQKNFRAALKEVFPSIALGFASSAISLVALSFSSFPIIKEISMLGLVGLSTAFLVSVTLCPEIAHRLDLKPDLPRKILLPGKSPHIMIIGLFIISTLFFGFHALKGKYDGDLKKLHVNSKQVKEDLSAIMDALRQGEGKRYVVVTSGASLEESLQRCEALIQNLTNSKLSFNAPCQVLPSNKSQMKNIDSFKKLNQDAFKAKLDNFGFNPSAFNPFFKGVDNAIQGRIPPITLESLPASSLKAVVAGSSYNAMGRWNLLTFVHSESANEVIDAVKNSGEGHIFFHFDHVSKNLARFIGGELPKLLFACMALIFLTLYIYFRSVKLALLALMPPLVSLVWLIGALSYFEYNINVVALCCVIFQLGIGLDYGIYVIRGRISGEEPGISHMAVRISAITTVISFCALLLAESPAIFIVGLTICLGVLAAMFSSRMLIYFPLGLLILLTAGGCSHFGPITPLPTSQMAGHVEFSSIVSISDGKTKNVWNAAIALDQGRFSARLSKGAGIPYLKILRTATTSKIECVTPSRLCHHIGQLLADTIKNGYYRKTSDPSYESGKVEMPKWRITYTPSPKEAGAYRDVASINYKKGKYTLVITRFNSAPMPKIDPSYKQ